MDVTTKILENIRQDIAALGVAMNARFDKMDGELTEFRDEFNTFREFVERKFDIIDRDIGAVARAVLRLMEGQPPTKRSA